MSARRSAVWMSPGRRGRRPPWRGRGAGAARRRRRCARGAGRAAADGGGRRMGGAGPASAGQRRAAGRESGGAADAAELAPARRLARRSWVQAGGNMAPSRCALRPADRRFGSGRRRSSSRSEPGFRVRGRCGGRQHPRTRRPRPAARAQRERLRSHLTKTAGGRGGQQGDQQEAQHGVGLARPLGRAARAGSPEAPSAAMASCRCRSGGWPPWGRSPRRSPSRPGRCARGGGSDGIVARVVGDELDHSSGVGSGRPGPSKRATTTVMLSGPSRSSARATSAVAGRFRSGSSCRICRISSSLTGPCRPSEQTSTTSPRRSVDLRHHHLHALLHAQRLQDDVGVLEALGLLGGHRARLDQLPGQRLVLGHLGQTTAAQDVAARVADLPDHQGAVDQRRRRCRWCPCRARSGCRATATKMRSLASSMARRSRRANGVALHAARPRPACRRSTSTAICEATSPAAAPPMPSQTRNSGALGAQRDLTAARVASSVRDCPRDVGDEQVVLVVLADQPDVGLAEGRDPDVRGLSMQGCSASGDVRLYPISNRSSSSPNPDELPG